MTKKLHVGGQAVIEGVMMKSDNYYSVSVWKDGKIKNKSKKIRKFRYKICYWPFVRGIFQLFNILAIGISSLIWSANQQTDEYEEFTFKELFFLLFTSAFFGILFFIVLPLYLTKLVNPSNQILFNIIDGVFRILVFAIYFIIITFMKDIKTLFEYHGAEHKAANCYEDGKQLTIKNCKKYSTEHPRCGTSFILIVLVISIVIFSFITSQSWLIRLLARIVLIPFIAGISYEILKLSARFHDNWLFKIIIVPGMWLQKLTTRKPSEKQIKVAIHSIKKIIDLEKS